MKKLSPNLFVTSVNKSISFYEKLGFCVEQKIGDENSLVWASMASENAEIMLQDINSAKEEFTFLANGELKATLTLFMQTDDLEKDYKSMKEINAKIMKDIYETFYGTKEFVVQDFDGYVCVIAQKLDK